VFGKLLILGRVVIEGDMLDRGVRAKGTSDAVKPHEGPTNKRPEAAVGDITNMPRPNRMIDGGNHPPSIATLAEIGDSHTVSHEARVADLAVALARQLGLSGKSVAALRAASRIHDLGKVWIPAEILGRPGKLSPTHFELVKRHPQLACELLQAAELPSPFWEIILQHHERLDGSGYPYGLTEEQIVPEAKILAVADVMDAMTSPRPHRPRLSIDAALQEILRGRGTVYDQGVVDACVDLFRRHVTAEQSVSIGNHADGSRCKPEPAGG
jgi:HD-GYP domain-containing protein (c-di-GMP phosphodiesterase class II)